jgi:hypothetical protein
MGLKRRSESGDKDKIFTLEGVQHLIYHFTTIDKRGGKTA